MRSARRRQNDSSSETVPALRLPWLPFAITRNRFARTIDALILCCSVLLFWLVILAWTNTFPALWLAGLLTVVVVIALRLLYWLAFDWLLGMTAGSMLAKLVSPGRTSGRFSQFRKQP